MPGTAGELCVPRGVSGGSCPLAGPTGLLAGMDQNCRLGQVFWRRATRRCRSRANLAQQPPASPRRTGQEWEWGHCSSPRSPLRPVPMQVFRWTGRNDFFVKGDVNLLMVGGGR